MGNRQSGLMFQTGGISMTPARDQQLLSAEKACNNVHSPATSRHVLMSANHIEFASHQDVIMLKLVGEIRASQCTSLETLLSVLKAKNMTGMTVNLSETTFLDSTTLGTLAKLGLLARQKSGVQPVMFSTDTDVTTLVQSMGLGNIYLILNCRAMPACLSTLPQQYPDQREMLEMVLEAHRTLSALSNENQQRFASLVSQLEQQCRVESAQTDQIEKPASLQLLH